MLPIRLGMVNANGPQDLFVYALTRKGRVETTNYRTTRLPSDMELPVYLKDQGEFSRFYKAMFTRQVQKEDGRTRVSRVCVGHEMVRSVCVESAVERANCASSACSGTTAPAVRPPNVFLTRLHVRYDNAHFPEDLVFQETADRANFQGRYVLRHAWTGAELVRRGSRLPCRPAGSARAGSVRLASLTGWSLADIRKTSGPRRRHPASAGGRMVGAAVEEMNRSGKPTTGVAPSDNRVMGA